MKQEASASLFSLAPGGVPSSGKVNGYPDGTGQRPSDYPLSAAQLAALEIPPLDMETVRFMAEQQRASAAGRVLAAEWDLEEGAAARRLSYPALRSTWDVMRDPGAMAERIIWDPVSGDIVQRAGHTARLLADGKGGKTCTGLEWCRSSLTGEPWLGHFHVVPVAAGTDVAFLDPELDTDFSWYVGQAFRGLGRETVDRLRRIDVLALKTQGWSWASEADREWLADQLAGCERLFADSILSLLPGGGSSGRAEASHSLDAVGEFLDQLKALQKRAGIRDVLVSIHRPSGGAEKSFGSIQWDAKLQALWSIKVEEHQDGTQTRRLRGMPGRAGTKFAEAEILQQPDGRVRYLVPELRDVVAAAARTAEENSKALEPGLEMFPFALAQFWDGGQEPGKQEAFDAVNVALRDAGEPPLGNRRFSEFWAEVERRALAVVPPSVKGKKTPVQPPVLS